MVKRSAYLHIGLPHSADFLAPALSEHATTLATYGVSTPARSADEMFRAAVEIRRDHRAWGLRRRDVEGVWAGIYRRARSATDDVVLSQELLAGATSEQVALLMDGLAGFDVHVVVTVCAPDPRVSLVPDELDLGAVLDRWSHAVRSPDHVHVLPAHPDDRRTTWEAFGHVLGVDTSGLVLPTHAGSQRTDISSLRLISQAASSFATYDDLVDLVASWSKQVADEGYDVRGDIGLLAPTGSTLQDPGEACLQDRLSAMTDALSDTLVELTRLRTGNDQLAARNAKLERKRRKLKRRLATAD